mgnify:CR=1 FL=1
MNFNIEETDDEYKITYTTRIWDKDYLKKIILNKKTDLEESPEI